MGNLKLLFFILYFFNLSVDTISKSENNPPSRKDILKITNEASNYLHNNDFEKSFVASRLALHYALNSDDNFLIAKSYNIIGANYDQLSETDKAIFYFQKGLNYANKTTNDTIKNWLNNNLGNIYAFKERQFNKGLDYYKKSLDYSTKIGSNKLIYFTKMNIAWAYFYAGNYKEGAPYLNFINRNKSKYAEEADFVTLAMLNGMFHTNNRDFTQANMYFTEAIRHGENSNYKEALSFAYEEYSESLMKQSKFKQAYINLRLYNVLSQALIDSEKLKRAKVVGINLELDEYKRKIDLIETENDLQAKSLQKTKIINILFVIALTVLLILFYSLFINFRLKKKTNTALLISNEELQIAKEKAEVASQLKSQFVSTISHELRTPLYGVVGITNLLIDEHKELANSPHLNSLKFSARYLLSLVNDILQINKIEENRIVLESIAFNISDEINLINDSLAFIAKNHNNNVTIDIDDAIPEYLIGDKLRFSQIIINLLSNALKFTEKGEVLIKAKLDKVLDNKYFIAFTIKDSGSGIAQEDQEKIFDKFTQVNRKVIDYQGTGLGLPIVKKLLSLFDSTINIESELGNGSTFSFVIPFEYDPYKTIESINNITLNLSSSEVYSVLVVDDNTINQLITKKIITNNNYECKTVDSGFAALDILENEKFDIILMDINMPLMNGFETTKKIRKRGIITPIIALTAFDKEEITEEAIAAGFNDIIVKPFDPILLFKIMNNFIYDMKENEIL